MGCASSEGPARPPSLHIAAGATVPDASVDAGMDMDVDAGEMVPDRGSMVPIYGSPSLVILVAIDFSAGSARIEKAETPELEELARLLNEQPQIELAVEGHADPAEATGSAAERLSRQRAEAVRRALVAAGVAEARLTVEALGADQMAAPTPETPHEHAQNRRARFRVTKQPPN